MAGTSSSVRRCERARPSPSFRRSAEDEPLTALGLREFLASRLRDGDLLPWDGQLEACERFGLSPSAVELAALEAGYLPARYRRNRTTLSIEEQLRLFRSRVAVIGCGGLGGYLVEELGPLGGGTPGLVR